jgi:hypothetical protein
MIAQVSWFIAVFIGSLAREAQFPSDEIEHGCHAS